MRRGNGLRNMYIGEGGRRGFFLCFQSVLVVLEEERGGGGSGKMLGEEKEALSYVFRLFS